jgi:hypothetical protein
MCRMRFNKVERFESNLRYQMINVNSSQLVIRNVVTVNYVDAVVK